MLSLFKRNLTFNLSLIALFLGCVLGTFFPQFSKELGNLSRLIIQVLKAFAVPLLFVAIFDSILNSQIGGRSIRTLLRTICINTFAAITIALVLVYTIKPGLLMKVDFAGLAAEVANKKVSWVEAVGGFFPDSILSPFVSGSTPAVILLAILFALAARVVKKENTTFEKIFTNLSVAINFLLHMMIQIMKWLVVLVPAAVLASVAKSVAQFGLGSVAGSLSIYAIICLGGMTLQMLIVYQTWIYLHPTITIRQFWREAKDAALSAFGINSSLATIPLTLEALKRLKVSDESARLSTCIGTNFNNDGILLYEVAASLMIAQAYGMHFSAVQLLFIIFVSIIATWGVSGFPEAGVVALTLVFSTIGVPLESITLLLAIDWLIGRYRSLTNVVADMAVAIAVDTKSQSLRA